MQTQTFAPPPPTHPPALPPPTHHHPQHTQAGDTCGVVMSRGTSMATPVVAGTAALLRQWFTSGRYMNKKMVPSGALLKAMLIHSSQRMLVRACVRACVRVCVCVYVCVRVCMAGCVYMYVRT
jgi:hypothetical protein